MKIKMKVLLLFILIFLTNSCSSQSTRPAQWHIQYKVLHGNTWRLVEQRPANIWVSAGKYEVLSQCRHNVLLYQHLLSEYPKDGEKFVIGLVTQDGFIKVWENESYTKTKMFYEWITNR